MPVSVLMPALSPTMTEGKLARWIVKEGDKVTSGDVIAEIETDKATMEVESLEDGIVGRIFIPEGTEGVAVNAIIAVIAENEDDLKNIDTVSMTSQEIVPVADNDSQKTELQKGDSLSVNQSVAVKKGSDRVFATPLAKRIAKDSGLELSTIQGSGPLGRILKLDVEKALANNTSSSGINLPQNKQKSTKLPLEIAGIYEEGSYDIQPLDNIRKTIAKRLVESKQTIPHFYVTRDINITQLLALRKSLNERSPKEGNNQYKLSVNDMIIKAMSICMQRMPELNVTWTEQGILQHKTIDIAIAVSIDGGLITPILRNTQDKGLVSLSNEMKELAKKARDKALKPQEYQGGTVSISNMGMFGVREFSAIINPPHALILAIGAGEKRPIVKGEEIVIADMMTVTASLDHRVVDGAVGAQMLQTLKEILEDPISILL